jgi:DNA-binding NarL/FixJ family response regulator
MNENIINVGIVDDHEVVVSGIKSILALDANISVKETFHSGESFVEYMKMDILSFEVLLLDFSLPGINGDEVLKKITKHLDKINVVVLTSFSSVNMIKQMSLLGAKCFVLKTSSPKEILAAVKHASLGESFKSEEIIALLETKPAAKKVDLNLTDLEQKLIRLTCEGMSSTEMTHLTGFTINTVKSYKKEIYKKLNVHNQIELIKYAIKNEILLIGSISEQTAKS